MPLARQRGYGVRGRYRLVRFSSLPQLRVCLKTQMKPLLWSRWPFAPPPSFSTRASSRPSSAAIATEEKTRMRTAFTERAKAMQYGDIVRVLTYIGLVNVLFSVIVAFASINYFRSETYLYDPQVGLDLRVKGCDVQMLPGDIPSFKYSTLAILWPWTRRCVRSGAPQACTAGARIPLPRPSFCSCASLP